MQYDKHIEGLTTHYKAITIVQPLADAIANGYESAFICDSPSDYRGEILIVSAPEGERGGMVVGRALLTSVKEKEGRYVYNLSEQERMIEFPCQKCDAKDEIWDCFYTANTLMPYPKIHVPIWKRQP